MTVAECPNWFHFDLKGANPTAAEMLRWVDWLAEAGFNGIVFEYEHMRRWQTFPETYRDGYSEEDWAAIMERCQSRGLEIVPLAQTMGHLEWLLRYDEYAHLREDGLVDELCPSNPEAFELIRKWLDELIDLHPEMKYIHLGGDEVWQLGRCPKCQERAGKDKENLIELFLDHMSPLIQHVLDRGVTPLIWADMFWPEDRQAEAARLPEGVVLIDWQYGWLGPEELTPGLVKGGHPVWAATGVRTSYDMTQVLAPLDRSRQNIDIWYRQQQAGNLPGIIHTCWARSSSFRPLYGPMEAWLPLFLYAADPDKGRKHPLFALLKEMDMSIYSDLYASTEKEDIAARIAVIEQTVEHDFEKRCCVWWRLALEYADCRLAMEDADARRGALGAQARQRAQDVTESYTHPDPHVQDILLSSREKVAKRLQDWEQKASAVWESWGVSNREEFFASRSGVLLSLLDIGE